MEALRGVGDPAAARAAARPREPRRGWRSRSRTATATTAGRGRRRSRRCARPACSTARRCACSPATTGPSILDPHGRLGAEAIAEFELAPVGELSRLSAGRAARRAMTQFQGDPYRDPRARPGRVARRGQVAPTGGWPSSTTPTRPARRAAALPRDPGGLRAARRRRGAAAARAPGGTGRPSATAERTPWRADRDARATGLARGLAGAARRRIGGGRRRRDRPGRRDAAGRRGTDGARPTATAPAAAPEDEAPPRERHTRRGSAQGDARARPPTTRPPTRRSTRTGTAARWYGPRRGTYWTLNPREYADPRKHGPEYQARARRAARAEADGTAPTAGPAGPSTAGRCASRGRPPRRRPDGADADAPGADPADPAGTRRRPSRRRRTAATPAGGPTAGRTTRPPTPPHRDGPGRRSRAATGDVGADVEPLPDLEAVARRAAPANLLDARAPARLAVAARSSR